MSVSISRSGELLTLSQQPGGRAADAATAASSVASFQLAQSTERVGLQEQAFGRDRSFESGQCLIADHAIGRQVADRLEHRTKGTLA
jgi:hypothetical protein